MTGADLSIRRTSSKHQRMPSHEAILKVAKQHKLPPPVLTAPQQQTLAPAPRPPAPPRQQPSPQQAVAPAAEGSHAQEPPQREGSDEAAAAAALASAAPRPCLPVFRPASASGTSRSSLEAQRKAEEAERQQAAEAAAAAYGEPWQARKERVQAASPHGRWASGLAVAAHVVGRCLLAGTVDGVGSVCMLASQGWQLRRQWHADGYHSWRRVHPCFLACRGPLLRRRPGWELCPSFLIGRADY